MLNLQFFIYKYKLLKNVAYKHVWCLFLVETFYALVALKKNRTARFKLKNTYEKML